MGRLAPDLKRVADLRGDNNGSGTRQAGSLFVATCRKFKLLVDGRRRVGQHGLPGERVLPADAMQLPVLARDSGSSRRGRPRNRFVAAAPWRCR